MLLLSFRGRAVLDNVDGDHANAVFFEIAGGLAVQRPVGDQNVDLIGSGEGGESGFPDFRAVGQQDDLSGPGDDQTLGISFLGIGRGQSLFGG